MEATATSQLETERKYDAGPDFVLPDLSELPGYTVTEPVTFQLAATYFDTDDLRLAANKVTLRRRTGGEDDAWHLKLPVRPGTRQERHLPLDADHGTGTVPAQMQDMVADFDRRQAAAAHRPAQHRPDHPPPGQPGRRSAGRSGRRPRHRPPPGRR